MKIIFNAALRKDLYSFVKKAFLESHGHGLGNQDYIRFMCHELSNIRTGQGRRFVITSTR